MKALQVSAPHNSEIIDAAEPSQQTQDILLRVEYVGLCGTDLSTFVGRNPLTSYPRIMGHEVAATVDTLPSSYDGALTPGAVVTVLPYASCGHCSACRHRRNNCCRYNQTLGVQRDGAMTEWIAIPPEKILAAPALTLPELALVEPLSIGFHAARRGRIDSSDTVAVFGCGGVGVGAIAGAVYRGANVIAVDIDERKLTLAARIGARHTLDSRNDDFLTQLRELTEGHGPDVVVEAIGSPTTFRLAVEAVAFSGRVVYIGYAKEPVTYETRFFVQKELDILGSRNAERSDFESAIQMLEQKTFPVADCISRIVRLEDAGAMLTEWSESPAAFSKILVDVNYQRALG